ncbi:ATP-binding protein [Photobacterium kagoshimensis]|uniref:ATP-binding protein n=1 Tax=Photobacterium kagoshimensis TaxID=2910242 RepID=UPI003D0B2448
MSGLLAKELLTQELGSVKSNIERIISSYRHIWDIYTELLQNSGDAILEKHSVLEKGVIDLSIDTVKRTLEIRDNGIGISHDDMHKILVTGKSLKRDSGNGKFGFMGFGFTFVAFQSCFLKIESVHDGVYATRTYKNLYKFIFDDYELPLSDEEVTGVKSLESTDESYTKIVVQFPQEFPIEEVEASLKSAFEIPLCQKSLEVMLRTKTIVGSLDVLFDRSKLFNFNLTVNGSSIPVTTGYLSGREVSKRALKDEVQFYDIDTYENFITATDALPESSKDISRRANMLDAKIENIEIGSRNKLVADFYISATSKTNLTNFMSDKESNYIEVEHGLWLSICGMPIGICLDSYEHASMLPYTVIVDIKNDSLRKDLDAGRKGLSSYRQKQIVEAASELLLKYNFRKYKKYITGAFDSRVKDPTYDPLEELKVKYKSKTRYDIDLLSPYFPLLEEQEVISTFIDLCSKNILSGYCIKALSGFQVYDAILDYSLEFSESIIYGEDNTIGISKEVLAHSSNLITKKDILVEFKIDIDGLFKDIDRNKKDVSHVNVLVCWDAKFCNAEKYLRERGDVLRVKDSSLNIYHGVTHELVIAGRSQPLPIIELNKVIQQTYGIFRS